MTRGRSRRDPRDMSSHAPTPFPSHPAALRATVPGPRHADPADERFLRARRWTIAVLGAATALLAAYVVLIALAVWFFASAWGVVRPDDAVALDLLALARPTLPVLLVGWCTGLAALAVVVRGEGLGSRTAGITSGLLGVVAGAAVLGLQGGL